MTDFRSVRVIIWDVDGTLYKAEDLGSKVNESAYRAIMEVLSVSREVAIARFHEVHPRETVSATEAVARICGISTGDAAKRTDRYLDRMRLIARDEKLVVLFQKLAMFSHYILGNGSQELIAQALPVLGLDTGIFKEIVTSEIVGRNKPDLAGYRYIMEKTGLPPDAHLMVGDRPVVDLSGAKALGMKTALVFSQESNEYADITLASVYDIAAVLTHS